MTIDTFTLPGGGQDRNPHHEVPIEGNAETATDACGVTDR